MEDITGWQWMMWSLILLMQNSAFTLVSRARNSSSLRYHAFAAVLSNTVWFLSQFFVVTIMVAAKNDKRLALSAGLLYMVLTTMSSVAMHAFLVKKVEGKIAGAGGNGGDNNAK